MDDSESPLTLLRKLSTATSWLHVLRYAIAFAVLMNLMLAAYLLAYQPKIIFSGFSRFAVIEFTCLATALLPILSHYWCGKKGDVSYQALSDLLEWTGRENPLVQEVAVKRPGESHDCTVSYETVRRKLRGFVAATALPPVQRPGVGHALYIVANLLITSSTVVLGAVLWPHSVDVTRLERVIPYGAPRLSVGVPAKFDLLSDYFARANEEVHRHVSSVIEKGRAGEPHRGMTLVSAPHGFGTLFLLQHILKDADRSRWIDISELAFETEGLEPQLVARGPEGQRVLGRMRTLDAPQLVHSALSPLDEAGLESRIVVITDLQFLHPRSCLDVLRGLDDSIRHADVEFLHLFVVGWPDCFTEVLREERSGGRIELFQLNPPTYESVSDLQVAIRDVTRFHVREPSDEQIVDLVSAAQDNKVVLESCHFLSHLAALTDLKRYDLLERDIGDILLAHILDRSAHVNNRGPSLSQSYVFILEAIGAKYADKVDAHGFFTVAPFDVIRIEIQNEDTEVSVKDVLQRSGLVSVALGEPSRRFRFAPTWIHEHLVRRYNRRRGR